MRSSGEHEDTSGPGGRFADDLVGLDPNDPQAQAFAEHLDRIENPNSQATVEGMLKGVETFAHSANRTQGHRRLVTVLVVGLMLFGVAYTVVGAVGFMLDTFFG